MKTSIEQAGFMDVDFITHESNIGDNRDIFTFKLRAEGQPIEVGGLEVDELSFDIIGGAELEEFLSAMSMIRSLIRYEK
jgi:hypothetical protein